VCPLSPTLKPLLAALLTGVAFDSKHGVFRGACPRSQRAVDYDDGDRLRLMRIYTAPLSPLLSMHGCYNLTLFLWQGA